MMDKTAFAIGVVEGMEKIALKPETVLRAMGKRTLRAIKGTVPKGTKDLSGVSKHKAEQAMERLMARKRKNVGNLGELYERGMRRAAAVHGEPNERQLAKTMAGLEAQEMKGYKLPSWMAKQFREGQKAAAGGKRQAASKHRPVKKRVVEGGGGGGGESKGMSTAAKVGIGAGIAGTAGGGAYLAHRATRRD